MGDKAENGNVAKHQKKDGILARMRKKDDENTNAEDELKTIADYKSFSKGMMDIALLSANINQLRFVVDLHIKHGDALQLMIAFSIALQVISTCLLILERRHFNRKRNFRVAHILNTIITFLVMIIILLNILITAFGAPYIMKSPLEDIVDPKVFSAAANAVGSLAGQGAMAGVAAGANQINNLPQGMAGGVLNFGQG
eukprot:TRINITY_DN25139_c0_g1_i1.p1 TRINITY_DN25139_c0_g1~~TRINITY_DN25139_c0_g1_i1.p1  ORF type:complete len:198 (+),score=53.19 TRINITY_DN25139_c0_g1_i1:129-722(+)